MKRFKLALSLLVCAFSVAYAQSTKTPYSMYGYGILNDNATSIQRQMGGVGIAMNSGRQINVMNPAAYAAMDSLTFLWDMGADLTFMHSKEGSAKESATGGGLDYLAMQFPISKNIGGSIGMLPYTSVGYAFGNEIRHGTMSNQGRGGINQAYIGFGGRYAGVALGVNAAYNFGKIVNDVYATPSDAGQTLFEHVMEIKDFRIDLGLQYTFNINRDNRMTLGLTYSPKKSIHGKTWCTFQEMKQESKPDTIGRMRMGKHYYLPNSFGAGINFTHQRASRFVAEADFLFQDWSKAKFSPMYDEDGKLVFDGMKFDNRYKFALGAEYVPRLRGGYFKRIAYRAGAYYIKDYLNINGCGVREYGVSAGLGLPTPEGKTIINLGFEYKHRGASGGNLISENYFNITLGINFNEVWFWQRKLK